MNMLSKVGIDCVKLLAEIRWLLRLIVTKKVGNRPGRHEPRAVISRPKTSFPILRKSRKVEQVRLQKKANKIIKMIEHEALTA